MRERERERREMRAEEIERLRRVKMR